MLLSAEKQSFTLAVEALRAHLESGRCALAAQEFRNAIQREKESVSDYISRLERTFQVACGHKNLTAETRDTLLYGQLQAGLKLILMESPAVSGSLSYKQLCAAGKQEEKRLLELKRRRQHQERQTRHLEQRYSLDTQSAVQSGKRDTTPHSSTTKPSRDCYVCGKNDHLACECKLRRGESTSVTTFKKPENKKNTAARTNAITSVATSLADLLHSSDSEDGLVNSVCIEDKGSRPRKVIVNLHGLPVQGVIDSGADITIMNGDTFKKVAAIARLRKKAFKSADKIPYGYDNKPFVTVFAKTGLVRTIN